jgi:hypothetical protein
LGDLGITGFYAGRAHLCKDPGDASLWREGGTEKKGNASSIAFPITLPGLCYSRSIRQLAYKTEHFGRWTRYNFCDMCCCAFCRVMGRWNCFGSMPKRFHSSFRNACATLPDVPVDGPLNKKEGCLRSPPDPRL